MRSYRGLQRGAQAAKSRQLEAAACERDKRANVLSLSDSEIVAAVYRLQGRNRRADSSCESTFGARIRELGAEQARRRKGALS